MCTNTGMAEHCGSCGGGLGTFSHGLSERADERNGAKTSWWVRWVSASPEFGGFRGFLLP